MNQPIPAVTADHVAQFQQTGFLVLPGVLSADECEHLKRTVQADLDPLVGPAEYEADVGYPGAPSDRQAEGGTTPRRLLHAYARNDDLRALALHPVLGPWLSALLASPSPMLSQCHHNCVMTKHPGYSSATLWHQDIRYWSFDRPELISAWFALGQEAAVNGALQVIPESHVQEIDRGRLDSALFLRPELA
ncbi:MAG: phytanoyl-CoA dioxygenase family protein, partial [Pseudomonadota bacterium]|nr:phytanoyl-CoA dioxygenase family protein [Pseudomonadota bacterium]